MITLNRTTRLLLALLLGTWLTSSSPGEQPEENISLIISNASREHQKYLLETETSKKLQSISALRKTLADQLTAFTAVSSAANYYIGRVYYLEWIELRKQKLDATDAISAARLWLRKAKEMKSPNAGYLLYMLEKTLEPAGSDRKSLIQSAELGSIPAICEVLRSSQDESQPNRWNP